MKIKVKHLLIGFASIILILLTIGLLTSTHYRYTTRRILNKSSIQLASLQGAIPQPIILQGKLKGKGAFSEAIKGASISAIETTSGYGVSSDGQGNFSLPHLIWYPSASYTLIVSSNLHQSRIFYLKMPAEYPSSLVIDLGELSFEQGIEISKKELPIRYLKFERENYQFYKNIFDEQTKDAKNDHEKADLISKHISTRYNSKEDAWSFYSAREIIERGAPHCSNLALAMAAVMAAGGYPSRTIHTSDTPDYAHTHVAVEVFYDGGWHLYDPTYGVFFLNDFKEVASYRELRLSPELIKAEAFNQLKPDMTEYIMQWMPGLYSSGIYQSYQTDDVLFTESNTSINIALNR